MYREYIEAYLLSQQKETPPKNPALLQNSQSSIGQYLKYKLEQDKDLYSEKPSKIEKSEELFCNL